MIRQQIINPFEYWSGGRGEPFSIQFNFLSESGNELQVFFLFINVGVQTSLRIP